jgi:malonate-semialdehyde dehydrogenase (acetylating) / methylmalonate-semialdehyde dehydrogenase
MRRLRWQTAGVWQPGQPVHVSGSAARKFRYEVDAGNIGINIGVAAPMAFFPFSGWKESFFGDMHGQGSDAVEFFTQKKVVVERWPKEWTRKF